MKANRLQRKLSEDTVVLKLPLTATMCRQRDQGGKKVPELLLLEDESEESLEESEEEESDEDEEDEEDEEESEDSTSWF